MARTAFAPVSGLLTTRQPASRAVRYPTCDRPAWPGSCGRPMATPGPSWSAARRIAATTASGPPCRRTTSCTCHALSPAARRTPAVQSPPPSVAARSHARTAGPGSRASATPIRPAWNSPPPARTGDCWNSAANARSPSASRLRSSASVPSHSGHSASPGARPSGSPGSASAGRRITRHGSPPCPWASSRRPPRSSRCQRVITSTMRPPGRSRVTRSERYQSHAASRRRGLSASSWPFTGSSISSRSARRPVTGPRTPTA